MTDKKENKTTKQRTQVKDLPKQKQELSKSEQKQVKGGARGLAVGVRIVGGGM
jgi:hypothetical protein